MGLSPRSPRHELTGDQLQFGALERASIALPQGCDQTLSVNRKIVPKSIGKCVFESCNMVKLPENGEYLLHRRPVGRVTTAVGQSHDTSSVYDEVAAQLRGIPLDTAPPTAGAHQSNVAPDRLETP